MSYSVYLLSPRGGRSMRAISGLADVDEGILRADDLYRDMRRQRPREHGPDFAVCRDEGIAGVPEMYVLDGVLIDPVPVPKP